MRKDETKTDFQKTLSACHTIHNYFRKALQEVMVPCPVIDFEETAEFLDDFTESFRPVFIVLDEIGAAHDDLNDIDKREKFQLFCLLGRGSFLSYVGLRPIGIRYSIKSTLKNTRMVENDEKTIQTQVASYSTPSLSGERFQCRLDANIWKEINKLRYHSTLLLYFVGRNGAQC